MKRWHSLLPNWAITTLLALLVFLSIISSYYEMSLVSNAMALGLIPLLLLVYFYRQKIMANIFYTIFILFFLGMILNTFEQSTLSFKLPEVCFFGAYALLLFVMIGKLKHVKLDGLVSSYLVLILAVNAYFMFIFFSAIRESFADSVLLALSASRGIALLIMALLAFAIYVSKETSQSIIFLMIVCCFVFSDVLSFITTMYIDFWLFEAVQTILQGVGLFLFCVYVYNNQTLDGAGVSRSKSSSLIRKSSQLSVHP